MTVRVLMIRPDDGAVSMPLSVGIGRTAANDEAKPAEYQEPDSGAAEARWDRVVEAVTGLNRAAAAMDRRVRFSVHEATKQIMVSIVDGDGTVIREVPPRRILDAYAQMAKLFGLLLDETA